MSEYYAEPESLEDISTGSTSISKQVCGVSDDVRAVERIVTRSKSLDGYGYRVLVQRARARIAQQSSKVQTISEAIDKVASLYVEYERRVVGALNDATSQGNGYTPASRHETRDELDAYDSMADASTTSDTSTTTITPGQSKLTLNPIIPGVPTPQIQSVIDWAQTNATEALEHLAQKLRDGGVMAIITSSGALVLITTATTSTTGMASDAAAADTDQGSVLEQNGTATGTQKGIRTAAATQEATTARGADATGSQGDATRTLTPAKESGTDSSQTGAFDASGGGAGGGSGDAGAGSGDAGGAGVGGGAGGGGDAGWVDDMLSDAVDTQGLQDAQQAVAQACDVVNPDAGASGISALEDSSGMGFATEEGNAFGTLLADFGAAFADVVRRYGLSAGILVSGAGAAYASSGTAVEAVAHGAEFMVTKCVPSIHDFVRHASATARVTQVSIRSVVSGLMQGAGGLIG